MFDELVLEHAVARDAGERERLRHRLGHAHQRHAVRSLSHLCAVRSFVPCSCQRNIAPVFRFGFVSAYEQLGVGPADEAVDHAALPVRSHAIQRLSIASHSICALKRATLTGRIVALRSATLRLR